MFMTKALFAGAALAVASVSAPAQASICISCGFFINYDVDSRYDISNIAIFERTANGGGITNSAFAPTGSSTITDPFVKYEAIVSTFLLGVAQDLEGDMPGQKHLVVFANDDWAASAQSIAFGTLFPSTLEASLIQALENIGGASIDPAVLDASYEALGAFDGGDAETGPSGSVAFAPGATFSLVAFSDGATIGTGISYLTAAPGPVPEPASWALMVGGFGLLGSMMRRRTTSANIQFA